MRQRQYLRPVRSQDEQNNNIFVRSNANAIVVDSAESASSAIARSRTASPAEFHPAEVLWSSPSTSAPYFTDMSSPLMSSYPSPPLYWPLSTPDIACTNSLILTDRDRTYLEYFPSSSPVAYYMKNWTYSCFNLVYQDPAASSKAIMSMILAISASDMHHRHRHSLGLLSQPPLAPAAEQHARYYYATAVRDLRKLLESPKRQVSQEELQMILVCMFLMVIHEWQYGGGSQNLQLHLQGVRSLLEAFPNMFRVKDLDSVLLGMEEDDDQSESSSSSWSSSPIGRMSFVHEQILLFIL